MIVDSAQLEPCDVVLEVGSGTGSLTGLMAEKAGHIVGVEIDPHLYELASEQLLEFPNVTLLKADALRNKNRMNELVMQTLQTALDAKPHRRFKLVANLPYNIATPIISNLLYAEPLPDSMTVTIQKELADRIVAGPWTKDYGSLSVWMQCQCDTRIVRVMPPSVFWPAPKVDSAIIRIDLDRDRRATVPDPRYFREFVKAIFIHRRKFLRANVVAAMKKHLSKPQVDEILTGEQIDAQTRTEQLGVEKLLSLTEAVRVQAPDWRL